MFNSFMTPWTIAHQAPLSMGFSRQEYCSVWWVTISFSRGSSWPRDWTESHAAAAAKSLQSCPTLCNPTDGSPPGSPVPGILQAGTLEWVAIAFSMSLMSWQENSLPPSHQGKEIVSCDNYFSSLSYISTVGVPCLLAENNYSVNVYVFISEYVRL